MDIEDLTGQQFGRLTVLGYGHRNPQTRTHFWTVRCICGTTKEVGRNNLKRGTTQSCGCLSREIAAKTMQANKEKGVIKPRDEYATSLPKIPFPVMECAYFISSGKVYSVAHCSKQVFQEVVTRQIGHRKAVDEVYSLLSDPTFDISSKWYILNFLADIGKSVTLYTSFGEAEQALNKKESKAS